MMRACAISLLLAGMSPSIVPGAQDRAASVAPDSVESPEDARRAAVRALQAEFARIQEEVAASGDSAPLSSEQLATLRRVLGEGTLLAASGPGSGFRLPIMEPAAELLASLTAFVERHAGPGVATEMIWASVAPIEELRTETFTSLLLGLASKDPVALDIVAIQARKVPDERSWPALAELLLHRHRHLHQGEPGEVPASEDVRQVIADLLAPAAAQLATTPLPWSELPPKAGVALPALLSAGVASEAEFIASVNQVLASPGASDAANREVLRDMASMWAPWSFQTGQRYQAYVEGIRAAVASSQASGSDRVTLPFALPIPLAEPWAPPTPPAAAATGE